MYLHDEKKRQELHSDPVINGFFLTFREEIKGEEDADEESTDNNGNTRGLSDGPPDDIRAFFGHPLTAAATAINGEETNASAAAFLHEYINLPSLDKSGMKIGETLSSIYDILRYISIM